MTQSPNSPQANAEKKERVSFLKSHVWMNRIIFVLVLGGGGVGIMMEDQIHEPTMQEYKMSDEEKKMNDEVNASLPSNFVQIALNKVDPNRVPPGTDPNARAVHLGLPGKDRDGEPLNPVFLEPEAKRFLKIYKHCYLTRDELMLITNSSYRTNGKQAILRKELPGLANAPGTSRHSVDAVDVSRKTANKDRPNPLTVDLEERVIYLEDIETPEGQARFAEVIKKMHKKELEEHPEREEYIVKSWMESVKEDLDNGVWGAHNTCMESFQKYGSSISHCGAVSNSTRPKALREAWHAQPSERMADCRRYDDTYNANIKMYRKYPPIAEDEWLDKMGNALKNFKRLIRDGWNNSGGKKWWDEHKPNILK